jgi:hypothetical protein
MAGRAPLLAILIVHVNASDEAGARAIFERVLATVALPAFAVDWEPYRKLGRHSRMSCYLSLGHPENLQQAAILVERLCALLVRAEDLGKGATIDVPNDDGTGTYERVFRRGMARFRIPRTHWFMIEISTHPQAQAKLRRYLRGRGIDARALSA